MSANQKNDCQSRTSNGTKEQSDGSEEIELTLQDAEGSPYLFKTIRLKSGETLSVPRSFRTMRLNLDNIEKMECRKDDVWIMTYPKAGRHWLCEIMSMLTRGTSKPETENRNPRMLETCSVEDLNSLTSPRTITTHIRPKYLSSAILNKTKIVHMIRNPKSVAVSYYHFIHKLPWYKYAGTFHGFFPGYIKGWSDVFGSWFEYVLEWWDLSKTRPNIYHIFYEELHKDTFGEVKKLGEFLGYSYNDELYKDIAKAVSFKNMEPRFGANTEEENVVMKVFMRKGTIDSWKETFTVEESEQLDVEFRKQMIGYDDIAKRIQFE